MNKTLWPLLTLALLMTFWAVVGSFSMEPTLEPGDLVILSPPISDCKAYPGKIVVYKSPLGILVIHRIIYVKGEGGICLLRAKGDANPEPDPYIIDLKNVVGIVVFVIPELGLISLSVRNPLGLLLTAFIAVTSLTPIYVLGLLKKQRSNV